MTRLDNRLDTTINLAEMYAAMLSDIAVEYPLHDQLEFKRDSKRVFQQSLSRGLPFFLVDLPNLDKALLAGLASGRLDATVLPHSRGKTKHSKVPRLFWALWIRLFDEDGQLLEDVDVLSLRHLRQLLQAAKKASVDFSDASLYATVGEFTEDDNSLPPTPPFWDSFSPIHRDSLGHLNDLDGGNVFACAKPRGYEEERGKRLLDSIQTVSDRVAGELGFFEAKAIRGRHGPGAVSELPASKFKYDFGIWSPNLEGVFDYEEFAVANITHVEDSLRSLNISFSEESSRLIPVPKTLTAPRLIAAEPVSHQWIQQGVANVLRRRVADTCIGRCIDFFDQRPSQAAALEASANQKRATVDLKSASDRLSCYVVQRFFRANFSLLEMMRACRTRFLSNDLDLKSQNVLRLRKFATMGSALTFPVQSIVFAVICLGVGAAKHPRRSLRTLARDVRVYGDDLIVPVDWVPDLERALTLLKLKMNANKSFWTGKFRESCGVDAYAGEDITPVRLRNLNRVRLGPDELASHVDVSNNFHIRGYWRTAAWLTKTVQQLSSIAVVNCSSGLPGLITFTKENRLDQVQLDVDKLRSCAARPNPSILPKSIFFHLGGRRVLVPIRWNDHLQRVEIRLRTLNKKSRSEPLSTGSPAVLLQYFTERVDQDFHLETTDLLAGQAESRRSESENLRHLDHTWSRLGVLSDRFTKPQKGRSQALVSLAWVPIARLVG